MAQAHACTAVLWLRSLLTEMGFKELVAEATPMMGDNDQATNLARDDILTQANRYFRLEYHFAKECFEAGDTSPLRVASTDNIADLLTHCLNRTKFKDMLSKIPNLRIHNLRGACVYNSICEFNLE